MVLQDTWLFGGTIRDNIMYGHPTATEDDMLAAARRRTSIVSYAPCRTATTPVIDEESSNLSAGEKQLNHDRARVPRRSADPDPREATSSVDTRTEVLVQRAMATLRERRRAS